MDLKDYVARQGWRPLHIGATELAELACRIQIGTPQEKVLDELRELRIVPQHLGFDVRHPKRLSGDEPFFEPPIDTVRVELGEIPTSLQDKVDEIKKLYELYDQLCNEEYASIKEALRRSEFDPKGGTDHYRKMRPFYFARGVIEAPAVLNTINVKATFLGEVGVTGGAQQELVDVLDRAEQNLVGVPVIGGILRRAVIETIPQVGRKKRRMIGGWNPRPIVDDHGNPTSLSPHAVGFAVDIKASTNEHLKGSRAKAIDAVLDHLKAKGSFQHDFRLSKAFIDYAAIDREPDRALELALEMWIKLMAISVAFRKFLSDNLTTYFDRKPAKPLGADVKKLLDTCVRHFGRGRLETIAKQGLFDEHLAMVIALIKAGARYGGEFRTSKDQHHFEVRNWQRRFSPPKCIEAWKKKNP